MSLISMQGKTNFFEKRVGEYSKAGVGADARNNHEFTLTAVIAHPYIVHDFYIFKHENNKGF